jgi:hypothetical protein
MKQLGVFEQHQRKIATATLRMTDVGAAIMGGMTKDEARSFLRSIGTTEKAIALLEATH